MTRDIKTFIGNKHLTPATLAAGSICIYMNLYISLALSICIDMNLYISLALSLVLAKSHLGHHSVGI